MEKSLKPSPVFLLLLLTTVTACGLPFNQRIKPGSDVTASLKGSAEVVATFVQPTRISREQFDLIVPAFEAEGIRMGQTLTGPDQAGMSSLTPTFSEATFRNFMDLFVTSPSASWSWKKMAAQSGYAQYLGECPYLLMLDTEEYMSGHAEHHVSLTDSKLIDALHYLNRAHDIMKEICPSSIITEYSYPNLPGYFLHTPSDAATWAYKPASLSELDYETEKARLIDGFRQRLSSPLAPSGAYKDHVDWGNFASYAYYYEDFMAAVYPHLRQWRSEFTKNLATSSVSGMNGSKPSSVIVSPFAFQDESRVWVDASGPDALPSTIWSDESVRDLLIKPATDQGVNKVIFWMDWVPYFADRAIRTPTSSQAEGNPNWTRSSAAHPAVGDSEVYFSRKVLNDLIVDSGLGDAVKITESSWNNNQALKTLAIRAGVSKTVRMARIAKALLQ
jgi:hypothetical protein